jgi:biotin carboxyl carrier protein
LKLKITVDGKVFEVDVEVSEPEPPQPVMLAPQVRVPAAPPPPGAAPRPRTGDGAPVADESKVCRSPISGMVVRVVAQSGQELQAGDILLVLEAMKMETTITAPVAGKLAKVNVIVGDAVQSGQVVVEFS